MKLYVCASLWFGAYIEVYVMSSGGGAFRPGLVYIRSIPRIFYFNQRTFNKVYESGRIESGN